MSEIDDRSSGLKMGFSDREIMLETEEAWCECCGKPCKPELYRRAAESYDPPSCQGKIINDYRSPCCHDELSPFELTRCEQCHDGVGHWYVNKAWMCDQCRDDYRKDHPSMEDLPEDDWRKDR
jgi:hypothetical protein